MDFGIEGAEPYLVMEFVEGETLRERVARTGGVPEAEAVGLIAEAAGALGRAHARGLVHRNVTPDSIVIRADGRAVLTDLCLIKEMDASGGGVTRDGTALGTPNFMAPEQIRNSAKANRSCDIYSLAATLYMAVTGQPPFAGCDILTMFQQKKSGGPILPRNLMPALSERTDRAIRRAMSAEPIHRPETCEEFLDNLTGTAPFEILGETPVQPAPTPPQPAPVPVARPAPVAMKIAPIRSEKKITAPAPSWLVRLWRWLISAETAAVTNASSTRAPSPSETNGRRVVRRRRVVRLPTNPKSPA
jgi:serine/threonine-protein kinase